MDTNTALKTYIESLNLIDPNKIDLETSVENDLGLTGDDAVDFIEEFSERFNVNIEAFDYNKYFKPEGLVFHSKNLSRIDLKLKNLVNAIDCGELE